MYIYMAGSTRFDLALKALSEFNGRQMTIDELRQLILRRLASSGKTVTAYLKLMEASGLTHEIEPALYKITL